VKKYRAILLLICVISTEMIATHIVGGEMNYQCLGDDQYQITLQVFRDCETGVPYFDQPASIGVFGASNDLVYDLRMMPIGDDTLNPQLQNPCLVIPPSVCYHSTMYDTIVTLPFREGGYQLAYQRCCRNQSIVNIELPLETGATYYSFISEEALLGCNNGARFNDWAPFYICAGLPFEFEHFAVDSDGDSIVYEMCAPFLGADPALPIPQPPTSPPYDSVAWVNPPYNTLDMLGGVPLTIDSETGFLTATPNNLGQYVVGICAKEYRNNTLISTTRRDFQFNVGTCGLEVVSSFFAPELQCDNSFFVEFDNQSEGSNNYFWDFGDPTTNDDTSTELSPNYTYTDTGTYEVTLTVGNGASACTDTFAREITLQYPPEITIEAEPQSIPIGVSSQLNITQNPNYTYEWSPTNSLNFSDIPNPIATPTQTTTYTVIVTNQEGCISEAMITVEILPPFCGEPNIFVPNAFTPNNDGENDSFRVRASSLITDFYFAIYDRWGDQIFESEDIAEGWDGTFRGRTLPPDVYGFYMQIRCANNEEYFKKGNVTLLR